MVVLDNLQKGHNEAVLGEKLYVGDLRNNDILGKIFTQNNIEAVIYGEPERVPIEEFDNTVPTNPYGESKLTVEKILSWCEKAYSINYTVLRYFNVAGAHTE